ncbi:hypothetical protein PAPYR_2476 [Paratrimastix pyriformis]|uniref:Uncharacterized protein n=1 Tax=Paratrimastix pyriformis TaxID=342808 RepID=A0ABQ8UPE3_9EUKA|nr:hypothetical protein PAPYR_2476 [Paratrimastix pyriformis]
MERLTDRTFSFAVEFHRAVASKNTAMLLSLFLNVLIFGFMFAKLSYLSHNIFFGIFLGISLVISYFFFSASKTFQFFHYPKGCTLPQSPSVRRISVEPKGGPFWSSMFRKKAEPGRTMVVLDLWYPTPYITTLFSTFSPLQVVVTFLVRPVPLALGLDIMCSCFLTYLMHRFEERLTDMEILRNETCREVTRNEARLRMERMQQWRKIFSPAVDRNAPAGEGAPATGASSLGEELPHPHMDSMDTPLPDAVLAPAALPHTPVPFNLYQQTVPEPSPLS